MVICITLVASSVYSRLISGYIHLYGGFIKMNNVIHACSGFHPWKLKTFDLKSTITLNNHMNFFSREYKITRCGNKICLHFSDGVNMWSFDANLRILRCFFILITHFRCFFNDELTFSFTTISRSSQWLSVSPFFNDLTTTWLSFSQVNDVRGTGQKIQLRFIRKTRA